MQVHAALVVDEIKLHPSGRVDLLGLREDLFFPSMPVILESLTLFVELEVLPGDRGQKHVLELRLSSAGSDGNDAPAAEATPIKFEIPRDYDRRVAHLDPTLFEVTFHRFGDHFLDLHLDGALARRVYLSVQPLDQAAG